jgi:NAD(P)H-flavin reductase
VPATVSELDWFGDVLRLRLSPSGLALPGGQHLVLWCGDVARPYSLASLPGEDDFWSFTSIAAPGRFATGPGSCR